MTWCCCYCFMNLSQSWKHYKLYWSVRDSSFTQTLWSWAEKTNEIRIAWLQDALTESDQSLSLGSDLWLQAGRDRPEAAESAADKRHMAIVQQLSRAWTHTEAVVISMCSCLSCVDGGGGASLSLWKAACLSLSNILTNMPSAWQ